MSEDKFIKIPCDDVGSVSDGFHTFDELYEHRCILFSLLMRYYLKYSWRSRKHDDGSEFEGWFVAGIDLEMPTGNTLTVTYHLPNSMWNNLNGVNILDKAPPWDGHTSNDVVERLRVHLELLIRNGTGA